MKRFLTALIFIAILGGIITFFAVEPELYCPYRGYSENVVLVIEPGARAPDLVSVLVERGVLAHRLPFLLCYLLGRARHQRLKAGEYLFDRPLSPTDVYQKLVRGDVYLHPVMIPEGSDRFDIAYILHRDLKLEPDEFLRITSDASLIRDLDPQAPSLEGYLFPDTYRFPCGVSTTTVVETMLSRFRRLFKSKLRRDLERSGATLHDVVTLASLVEKETPDRMERPLVAGVFARRVQIGMHLGCDPTVVYAARLNHRKLERALAPILRSDLQFDSPYNTYLHAGLPPGPIANPGEASIRAALAPAPSDALYFVSNNHGGHIFSSTLAEHERNVARYRREVAELRSFASEESVVPGSSALGEQSEANPGTLKSAQGAKQKQKRTHSRVRPGA